MADSPTRPAAAARTPRGPLRGWLAAVTFVVGLFAGALLVGLLSEDPPLPAAGTATAEEPATDGADPASPQSSGSASGGTAQVVVNDACLRAINAAQDVYGAVGDLGEAAADLNAARLDEAIRRLQPLQDRLRDGIAGCQAVTRLPDGSAVTSTPPLPTSPPAPPS